MNICFSHTPPFHLHLSLGIYVRTYLCLQKRKINYYDSYLICICWQTSLPMCSRVFITYIHTYIHTPLKCLYQAPSLVNNNNDTVNNKKGFRIFFFFSFILHLIHSFSLHWYRIIYLLIIIIITITTTTTTTICPYWLFAFRKEGIYMECDNLLLIYHHFSSIIIIIIYDCLPYFLHLCT